jgi:hypothetical protein
VCTVLSPSPAAQVVRWNQVGSDQQECWEQWLYALPFPFYHHIFRILCKI